MGSGCEISGKTNKIKAEVVVASAFCYKDVKERPLGNLTHRNRVEYSRLNRLEIQRCGPPSPAGRALFAALFGLLYKMEMY